MNLRHCKDCGAAYIVDDARPRLTDRGVRVPDDVCEDCHAYDRDSKIRGGSPFSPPRDGAFDKPRTGGFEPLHGWNAREDEIDGGLCP